MRAHVMLRPITVSPGCLLLLHQLRGMGDCAREVAEARWFGRAPPLMLCNPSASTVGRRSGCRIAGACGSTGLIAATIQSIAPCCGIWFIPGRLLREQYSRGCLGCCSQRCGEPVPECALGRGLACGACTLQLAGRRRLHQYCCAACGARVPFGLAAAVYSERLSLTAVCLSLLSAAFWQGVTSGPPPTSRRPRRMRALLLTAAGRRGSSPTPAGPCVRAHARAPM